MADLHWFPFFAKDWLSSPARMAMKPEQRGAYIDLLALAWGNGSVEPCLDPSPEILAGLSGLGDRWPELGKLILAQFKMRDGLLYNAKLSKVWREQQKRYSRRAKAGAKGGRAKARGKQSSSNATAMPQHAPMDMVMENQKDSLSRGAGAPAPSEARPAPTPAERRNGGGLTRLTDILPAELRPRTA